MSQRTISSSLDDGHLHSVAETEGEAQIETISLPTVPVTKGKAAIAEALAALESLDEMDAPKDPTEEYLDGRSGKYALKLERLAQMAEKLGLFELATSTYFGLLKLTKAGRARADVNISGVTKLREEADLRSLTAEQIAAMLRRPNGPSNS